MLSMPIVKIELHGMRQTIAHAFSQQQLELTGAVDAALKRAVDTFDFEGEVTRVAHEVLRESVKDAVRYAVVRAFDYEQKQEVILPIVREALRRALEDVP